jgi:NADH-quinone oxidoreductase subunit A
MANKLFFIEYSAIFFFLTISLLISCLLVLISFLLSERVGGTEKLSTYECGFEPFEDGRNSFNISFYLIAILFIVFDIEVVLLYPWAVNFFLSENFSFWIAIDFIIELVIGYYYVVNKNSLLI